MLKGIFCNSTTTWLVLRCLVLSFVVWTLSSIAVEQAAGQAPSASLVHVVGLQGEEVDGKLDSMSTDEVVIEVKGQKVVYKGNAIERIEFSNKLSAALDPIELTLVDGTQLIGAKLRGKDSGWQFGDSAGGVIDLGPGSVRSALVKQLGAEARVAWNAALTEAVESDSLMVVRPGNVLDRVNGMVNEVRESKVLFDLDGQNVEVAFEKLAGIIWFRKPLDRIKPTIRIQLNDHSTWYVESLQSSSVGIDVQTQFAKSIKLPFNKILRVDYAHANLKWLNEIEPIESVAEKRVDWKADLPMLQKSQSPRFVVNQRAETSNRASSDFDLAFPMPGRFVFRVPEGFTKFESTVTRQLKGDLRSDLKVEVWQDDQRVWQGTLAAKQDSLAVETTLVAGKKVRLVVACDTKLMVGTSVHWLQPRLRR